ncbi:hypothetical protein [Paenibacillus macerans]|uniref:hypothetical protein n=1 Tax=Paenibacillus macerans TaxID=44252 RepID=UPI0022DEE6D9|nr:hypothetical protein [Paenibacillus macerans]
MNELLKSFLSVLNESNLVEVSYTEDITIFNVSFKSQASEIARIAVQYKDIFERPNISFEVFYESLMDYSSFLRLFEIGILENELELKLAINKKEYFSLSENVFLFFRLDSFLENCDVFKEDFLRLVNMSKKVIFYLPTEKHYSSNFLDIIPLNECSFQGAENQNAKIIHECTRVKNIHNENSNSELSIVPDFFSIGKIEGSLKSWFDKNLFNSSLVFLSNKLIKEDQNFKVIIKGHKNIEIKFTPNHKVENAATLYKIYKFSIEEKHHNDKIEITRNIFTIYLETIDSTDNLDKMLLKIEKTISSHFSAYIQDSIKKFFNDRKDVIKEAHKHASDLKSETDKLLSYINTSLIGVITAIFSGAIGLSKGERWFLIVAFVLHLLLFLISYIFNRGFVEKRVDDILQLYKRYTANFVILANDELDEIESMYLTPAAKNIEFYLKLYKRVILCLIIFMVLLIYLGLQLPESFFTKS